MKHTLRAVTSAVVLVASLAACGGGDEASLPIYTGGSVPSTTATSGPATTTPPPTSTATGPVALAASSTYTYGGLKVVVNLPTDVPGASSSSLRLFSDFLQGVSRTIARNKLDPAVSSLASAEMVKYVSSFTEDASVQGIGSMKYTISKVQTGSSGVAVITGCADQSKLVQVRKDGSHYVGSGVKKYPTLTMTANINPSSQGPRVTAFTISAGSC